MAVDESLTAESAAAAAEIAADVAADAQSISAFGDTAEAGAPDLAASSSPPDLASAQAAQLLATAAPRWLQSNAEAGAGQDVQQQTYLYDESSSIEQQSCLPVQSWQPERSVHPNTEQHAGAGAQPGDSLASVAASALSTAQHADNGSAAAQNGGSAPAECLHESARTQAAQNGTLAPAVAKQRLAQPWDRLLPFLEELGNEEMGLPILDPHFGHLASVCTLQQPTEQDSIVHKLLLCQKAALFDVGLPLIGTQCVGVSLSHEL